MACPGAGEVGGRGRGGVEEVVEVEALVGGRDGGGGEDEGVGAGVAEGKGEVGAFFCGREEVSGAGEV